MRDHAAAYASAAAGAAWAAAQIAASSSNTSAAAPTPPVVLEQRRGRRRQRDPDWSSLSSRRHHPDKYAASTSSDDGAVASKRKPDSNLVGKTGVSALYEWCDKRRKVPKFKSTEIDSDFCFTVTVEGKEWGQGKGTTKAAAKQDAARRALQALLPGVLFDNNGIVVDIPSNHAVEELGPSLAERLSIGNGTSDDDTKRRRKQYEIYSTTTSEDDDENAYYASRGASVCSALLHAMWQINEHIPEPPAFDFEISPNPAQLKRKAGSTISVHRSSFKCTARLLLKKKQRTLNENGHEDRHEDDDGNENNDNDDDNNNNKTMETMTAVGTGATKREARHVASAKLLAMLFPECDGMVQVKAAAEAAREAHAAQKAMKQQTKRHASFTQFRHARRRLEQQQASSSSPRNKLSNMMMGAPMSWDPPLPKSLSKFLCTELGFAIPFSEDDLAGVNVEALSISEKPASAPKETVASSSPPIPHMESKRPNSRQKQLEDIVESALQQQGAFGVDDDVNDEDVGRTVLRMGEASDLKWIYKLLTDSSPFVGRPGSHQKQAKVGLPGPFSVLQLKPAEVVSYKDDGIAKSNVSSRLWGPVTIILLLCRAIAPLDEPPLGCSILTVGFSMTKGKILRVAEIGFEPHLPRERFIECLEKFAANMNCTLEVGPDLRSSSKAAQQQNQHGGVSSTTEMCWTSCELRLFIEEHIKGFAHNNKSNGGGDSTEDEQDVVKLEPGAPLQSVQEETEFDEDSKQVVEDPRSQKQTIKPSKRSRVH